jgi:hypothetical protein
MKKVRLSVGGIKDTSIHSMAQAEFDHRLAMNMKESTTQGLRSNPPVPEGYSCGSCGSSGPDHKPECLPPRGLRKLSPGQE